MSTLLMRLVTHLFVLFLSASATIWSAHAYEDQLRDLAGKLVAQLESAGQKSATVVDFTDLQGQGTELGRFLAQELSDQLFAAAKTLSLVERANLKHLMREHKFAIEGLVDPETARKLGKLIGVDTVISGTVTPMGDSIRLSVRADAVETGKRVASQSATLPATQGLADLYPRGLASPQGGSPTSPAPDVRTRFRADSIKATAREVLLEQWLSSDHATITLNLQNLSGIGFGAGIRYGATSIGGCTGYEQRPAGLPLVGIDLMQELERQEAPENKLAYFAANQTIIVSVKLAGCQPGSVGPQPTSVSMSLVIASGQRVFVMPFSVSGIPVRVTRSF